MFGVVLSIPPSRLIPPRISAVLGRAGGVRRSGYRLEVQGWRPGMGDGVFVLLETNGGILV